MVIGFCVFIGVSAAFFSPVEVVITVFFAVEEDGIGSFFVHSTGSADGEVAAVVSWQCGIQGQLDGFAVCAVNHGGDDISLGKVSLFQFLVIALILQNEFVESCRFGSEGRQCQHPVSVVDVQNLGNRTKIVSWIVFAVSGQIVSQAVMSVFLTESDLISKVMLISTGAVNDLSKYALLSHI